MNDEANAPATGAEYCSKCGAKDSDGDRSVTCEMCGNPFVPHPDPASLFAAADPNDPGPVPGEATGDAADAAVAESVTALEQAQTDAELLALVKLLGERIDNIKVNVGTHLQALAERIDGVEIDVAAQRGALADFEATQDENVNRLAVLEGRMTEIDGGPVSDEAIAAAAGDGEPEPGADAQTESDQETG